MDIGLINVSFNQSLFNLSYEDMARATCIDYDYSLDVTKIATFNIILWALVLFFDLFPQYDKKEYKSRLIAIAFMVNVALVFLNFTFLYGI